jgi:hypothetical protein
VKPWVLLAWSVLWVGSLLVVLDTHGVWSHVLLGVNLVVLVVVGSPGTPLGDAVMHAIYDDILSGAVPRIRSLSVGDTVQVGEIFLMCQSMGFEEPPAPVTPARTRALQILADVKPDFEYRSEVYPAQFAHLMWPDSPAWSKISNVGHGAARGVGIKRSAGALLGKMEREGLVRSRNSEIGQSFYSITRKGRQVLAFTKASA